MNVASQSVGRIAVMLLLGIPLLPSCGSKSQKISAPAAKGASANASDPNLNGAATPTSGPNSNQAIKDSRVLDVTMHLTGRALGISACSGDLRLQILIPDKNSTQHHFAKIPEDTTKCILIGQLGIAAMLDAPPNPNDPQPPPLDKMIVSENSVIGFRRLMGPGDYQPYRPFLPAFLSATPAELQVLNVSKDVDLVGWADGKSSHGTVRSKMLQYRRSFVQDSMAGREFNEVYDFEFLNEGFENVGRLRFFLFDRMMLRISLKPFAVLRLELDTRASDLVGAMSGSGATGAGGAASGIGGAVGSLFGSAAGGGSVAGIGGALGPLFGVFTKLIKVHIEGDTIDLHGGVADVNAPTDNPGEVASD